MVDSEDRGATFDGVRLGRPATGALVDAGYRSLADLPADLDQLVRIHGVGPGAVQRLQPLVKLVQRLTPGRHQLADSVRTAAWVDSGSRSVDG